MAAWLALTPDTNVKKYVKEVRTCIRLLKGLSNHKYCNYDTLKQYGEYCYIIKPASKKCYVVYNILNDKIFVNYVKPCSQAYDY